MRLLIDTQLLLWLAFEPERLSRTARSFIEPSDAELSFSVVSIWEVAIKRALGRTDFDVDPRLLRHSLLENGYIERVLESEHCIATGDLPTIHKDPFNRVLMAQANVENLTMVTTDSAMARYTGVQRV